MNPNSIAGPSLQKTKPGFFTRERIIAGPTFNRWLIPPAALAVHLCIGMAYGFSVFWLPLSRSIGITEPVSCAAELTFFQELFTTTCDWRVSTLGWMYTLFFVFLGMSAALWGGWLEKVGPRRAGAVAAVCWSGGMMLSAVGVYFHQFWLMLLGSGVIGGIGLGLGYISPVSTLIKWFPDRRGMATGMAIMGFGGGAMIGSPLAVELMERFASEGSVGVAPTFVAMGAIYFVFMMSGSLGYRIPADDWKPKGWEPPAQAEKSGMIAKGDVHVKDIWRIPQFWLIWLALCMNVSAGIGVIGMASPMLQEVFGGSLIGVSAGFGELNGQQLASVAAIAAGFTALLSLFNIGGRFFWASLSDKLGRKTTFALFFVLGGAIYASVPTLASSGNMLLFVAAFCVILSMYGGGFSTVPAYLADLFGTKMVGAIHGRLLTAWATAGMLGPIVVNYMRDYQLGLGLPRQEVYNQTMFILVGMLFIGFVANLLVRPVDRKYFMKNPDAAVSPAVSRSGAARKAVASQSAAAVQPNPEDAAIGSRFLAVGAWAAVAVPLGWGIYRTVMSAKGFWG